ncbi:hypothetical protein DL764_007648 [Monosporascus ibericus]|uniref:Uncharacterized protein n=1 Tax=Monosporascus ibericus TaxID=155417 RepID=A0A4Q4T1L4_9PEZI|nr:hypothetical protein DL764_007648 [Monosporascus ibericus]
MQTPDNALDRLCKVMNNFLIADSKTVTQDGRDGAHPANETGINIPRSDDGSDSDGSIMRPRSNDGFASDWYDCDGCDTDGSDSDEFDDEFEPVYADASEISLTSSAGLILSTNPSRASSPLPLRVLETREAHVGSGEAGSAEVEADVSCSEAGTSKAETLLTVLEEDLWVPNHGSRCLHPAPRSWVDGPVPPQNPTTLEEELQMWKTECLHQRQFIYRISRKLASKRISAIVDTRLTIRPNVHRKLLDVVEVIATTFDDRHKSFLEHANGAENEPQLTRTQLLLDYSLQRGLALKDKLEKASDLVKQAPHITVEIPEISALKEQLSNLDLKALINDPKNHNTIRDLIAEQLAQRGIILDAQFDMDQIIIRLSHDSSKPGYDSRNLDNVRQLFLGRASSFGQDLRQSWDPVLGLLFEKQFAPREPSSYMRGFMIVQDPGNNSAWAAAFKWPVKRLLREAVDILSEAGISAEVGDNDQKLTFTGVATDGVGCLSVAIKCGLTYKKSLVHLEQSLRAACDIVTLNPYTTSRGDASEQEDADLSFHTNLWTKVYEAWDRAHKRVGDVTGLLNRYASVSRRIYHDTAGTTDCRALIVEAVQNVVATRQVRRFHADLVARAPLRRQHQAAAGSHEERLQVQLEGREIRVFELEHEAGLRAVQLDETQHRLRILRDEIKVGEARTAKVLEEAAISAHDTHMKREAILNQLQDKLYAAETRALELEAQIQRHDVELEEARKQTSCQVAKPLAASSRSAKEHKCTSLRDTVHAHALDRQAIAGLATHLVAAEPQAWVGLGQEPGRKTPLASEPRGELDENRGTKHNLASPLGRTEMRCSDDEPAALEKRAEKQEISLVSLQKSNRGDLEKAKEELKKTLRALSNSLRHYVNVQGVEAVEPETEAVARVKQAFAYLLSGVALPVWADTETAARRKMIKLCDLRRELGDACRTNHRLVHSLGCVEAELFNTRAERRRSESKVAVLEQKVGETEEALAREKETVAELRQKVEHMEDEHRDVLEGISTALGREKATVSRLQGELDETRNRVDIIRKLKQGFDPDVATLEEKVGEGQKALAREQENVARLELQIEDLSNHNNALEVQLANQARLTATCTRPPTSLVRPRSNTAIAVQPSMVPALVISTSSPVHSPGAPLASTPSPTCAGYHVDTVGQQLRSMVPRSLTRLFECVLETPIAQEHVPTISPSPWTDDLEEPPKPSEASSDDSLHSCQSQFDSKEEESGCVNPGHTLDMPARVESSLHADEDDFNYL